MLAAKSTAKGHAPTIKIDSIEDIIGNKERFKYEEAWKHDDYRKISPGEMCLPIFMDTCKPQRNAKFVDWGAGTGRAGHQAWKQGLDVTLVDFVDGCLDKAVRDDLCDSLSFIKHDLAKPIDVRCDFGYCCDVLEHIPESDLDKVLKTIVTNSGEVFFNISTVEDHFGDALDIGPLHVTVHPYAWWLKKFAEMELVVLHSNEFPNHCLFHVSGHRNFWWTRGGVNTPQDVIHGQIRENAKWEIEQLRPHGKGEAKLRPDDEEPSVILLAGGPSLSEFEDEIRDKRDKGHPLITVNNTFNWALDRGLIPSLQFMIDAREFNNRFVERHAEADTCKFVIASQCHPSVFEMLPKDRTSMWHISLEDEDIDVIKDVYGEMYKDWFPVPGGCSVTLRALCALQMIGFRKVELYGFDSSLKEDEHHAYEQTENDGEKIVDVRVAKGTKHERTFKCHPFMAVQAREFQKLTSIYFQNMDLIVHGDGLIAHLIKTGASL
jgi:hypothetical protein